MVKLILKLHILLTYWKPSYKILLNKYSFIYYLSNTKQLHGLPIISFLFKFFSLPKGSYKTIAWFVNNVLSVQKIFTTKRIIQELTNVSIKSISIILFFQKEYHLFFHLLTFSPKQHFLTLGCYDVVSREDEHNFSFS